MRCRHSRARGFSLVEILVSSLILGLSLVAMSQLYMGAMWTYEKARKLTVATDRAHYELEKVRNLGYNMLINGINYNNQAMEDAYLPSEYSYQSTGMGVTFTVNGLPQGRGSVLWAPYPTGTPLSTCKMMQVTVKIEWDGSPKAQSAVTLNTLCVKNYK